jgi:hypothetical protein
VSSDDDTGVGSGASNGAVSGRQSPARVDDRTAAEVRVGSRSQRDLVGELAGTGVRATYDESLPSLAESRWQLWKLSTQIAGETQITMFFHEIFHLLPALASEHRARTTNPRRNILSIDLKISETPFYTPPHLGTIRRLVF